MELANTLSDEERENLDARLKFSPSRLDVHRFCARKGYYEYGLRLEPSAKPDKDSSQALLLGTIVHKYAELWHSVRMQPAAVFNIVATELGLPETYEFNLLNMTALTLMQRYIQNYNREQSKVLATEQRLTVPYSTPNGVTVYLDGIVDRLELEGNRLGVIDVKTSSRNAWYNDTLVFNHQTNQYTAMIMLCNYMPEFIVVDQIYTGIRDARKIASEDRTKLFSRPRVDTTPTRIERWLGVIGREIDKILEGEKAMNLGAHCTRCPFRTACALELDGKDPTPWLDANCKPKGSPTFEVSVELPF